MSDSVRQLHGFLPPALAGYRTIRVLEAGCGSASHLQLDDRMVMTGFDISQKQLDRHPHLAVRIRGDLQSHPLPSRAFDLVVCWDVLEHLPHPSAAVDNLADSVAPGGHLVLKVPNALSPKALVTKLTPYRFHVWFYRRLMGHDRAGQDDVGPFPTCMSMAMRPAALRRRGRRSGLEVVFEGFGEAPAQVRLRRRWAPLAWAWALLRGLLRVASRGRYDIQDTEYVLVLRRSHEAEHALPSPAS